MYKIRSNPLSSTHISKNGIKTATLQTAGGLSLIGAMFKIGSCDSDESGETFLTLQSKILESIGKPEDCYRNGIEAHLRVFKDYSAVFLSFMKESERKANIMLDRFFSNERPSKQSIEIAQSILTQQEAFGNIPFEQSLEGVACAASFDDPRQKINIYTNKKIDKINMKIIEELKSKAMLIGTKDQERELIDLANSFRINRANENLNEHKMIFKSGFYVEKSSHQMMYGNKLIQHADYPKIAISFPAASFKSDDYLAYKVIKNILGGGKQFSSEGIGNGLNSLLYTKALSYGCECLQCEFWPYQNNGLISIIAKVHKGSIKPLTQRIKDCIEIATKLDDEFVEMSKEQTINSDLKHIDSHINKMLEFGKEHLLIGESKDQNHIINSIRSLKKNKIIECIKNSFSVKPAISVIGDYDPQLILDAWIK